MKSLVNWYRCGNGKSKLKIAHGVCLYHESCSTYAERVIREHGTFKGTVLTLIRLIRCNKHTVQCLSPLYDKRPQDLLSDDLHRYIKPKVRMIYRGVGYWKEK